MRRVCRDLGWGLVLATLSYSDEMSLFCAKSSNEVPLS